MDQSLVAMLAVCALALFGAGYFIGSAERKSRRAEQMDLHSYRDNLEARSRRLQ